MRLFHHAKCIFVRRTSRLFLGCTPVAAGALPALRQRRLATRQERRNRRRRWPGGGTDQLGRLIQSIIPRISCSTVNTIVLNKGGGNGAEAFLDMKMNKGDAEKLVIGTNNIYLLPLVSKLGCKWQELTPVAAVAEDDFILWSYKDAPWKDAKIAMKRSRPTRPTCAWAAASPRMSTDPDPAAEPDHQQQAGVHPVQERQRSRTQLAGKHIAANVTTPAKASANGAATRSNRSASSSKERMAYTEKVAGDKSWADVADLPRTGPGHRSIPSSAHRVHARRRFRRAARVLCRA